MDTGQHSEKIITSAKDDVSVVVSLLATLRKKLPNGFA